MVDSIMADDEEEPAADPSDDDSLGGGGGGLMAGEGAAESGGGGDDLGGLGGLDDGGDDLGGLDEGFGEMEGGEDAMAGGGGGNVDELEHRLDELENEVGSLSSTVNTVRNENEQISESVQEVEENVRKLLDIYEMVTRGVNPFADEMDAGMGMGGGMDAQDGSFGLFTDDDGGDTDDSVDEDIADADAEGFFDDDLVGDEPDEPELDAENEEDDDSGGSTFDELKEEHESGEADWADEAGDDLDDDFEEIGDGIDDDGLEEIDDDDADLVDDGDLADDDLFDETINDAPGTHESDEDAASPAQADRTDSPVTTEESAPTEQQAGSSEKAAAGKPYLATPPSGIATDLLVTEWLEYLVEEVGIRRASDAIQYYETIDWITEEVADVLDSYLGEFDSGEPGSLTADHHRESLAYIDQLNGGETSNSAATPQQGGGLP